MPLALAFLCCWLAVASSASAALPEGFVDAAEVVPDLVVEMKYATAENFVGTRVDGYHANRAILTREAADALREVQLDLLPDGLGLKVYDAYRPQRAIQHFVRWAQESSPSPRASAHHPELSRRELFSEGYLALESAHARGSAVDLTLVTREPDGSWREIDMGTPFDFFSPESGDAATRLTPAQRTARAKLRTLMVRHGFRPSAREWWHFTLAEEPYPETYYDFMVE